MMVRVANAEDELRGGAPISPPAGARGGSSVPTACRREPRQLYPLVRRDHSLTQLFPWKNCNQLPSLSLMMMLRPRASGADLKSRRMPIPFARKRFASSAKSST